MQSTPHSSQFEYPGDMRIAHGGFGSINVHPDRRSQAMRLRMKVYLGVFFVSLVLGLVVNFSRSPIYRATARVQITPPGNVAIPPPQNAPTDKQAQQAILIEMEVLTSTPLLEKTAEQLHVLGLLSTAGSETVSTLQGMIKAGNVEGTPVVTLQAQGSQKALVAPLLNTLLEIYRAQQTESGDASSQIQLHAAKEELDVVEAKFREKQSAIDTLRLRANTSSGEREENQTLIHLKGLTTSLSDATDREATASGRVRAMEQAIAEGRRSSSAKDNPTAAAIEARLSQAKEDWRALERQFTSKYLEMDPNAIALKVRISNLEQQLESERHRSQQASLADAREDLASAQATAQRLQQQIGSGKQEVNAVNRVLGQMQNLQDELKSLALLRNAASQKVLALQASETARMPHLVILEPAVAPDAPDAPEYWRDAGIVLLASAALGFLSVWFVEFFNRKEAVPAVPATVVVPSAWMVHPQGMAALNASSNATARLPFQSEVAQQMLASPLPRELDSSEIQQLLQAATPKYLPLLACLLSGLTAEEVIRLQWQHLDILQGVLRVPGESRRDLPLSSQLRNWAEISGANRGPLTESTPVFALGTDCPLEVADVQAIVASSVFDSDLVEPQSITPASLRHTYVAFLVRQGLRFSELGALVGRLNTDTLTALALLAQAAPTGSRVGVAEVQKLLPALMEIEHGLD